MTFDQIMKELKERRFHPIYFLQGDEPYFIDEISNFVAKNVLTDSEKSFNQVVLYGKDTEVANLITVARRFPMMASHQVVIVKEAQELKKIEDLIFYVQKPQKSTILVINHKYKTIDKRKKLYSELDKCKDAVFFESKKLYDNQVPDWIEKYAKNHHYNIDPVACAMLNEFLGNDLAKIANELSKLAISLPQGTLITSNMIQDNIGISKDYNTFELQNALMKKDVLKANRIINYFAKNPKDNPLILTITSLFYFFSKVLLIHFIKDQNPKNVASVIGVNPYFVKDYLAASKKYNARKTIDIIGYLREYDLKSKGFGAANIDEEALLKELIFKILH